MAQAFDARLTWIQHLAPSGEMAIATQGDISAYPLLTMIEKFTNDSRPIEIIHKKGVSKSEFTPLDPEEYTRLRSKLIVYIVSTREPSFAIRRKLSSLGQEVTGEYSVLSSWNNPRWFIPQTRSLSFGKMSGMIKPTRPVAQAAVFAFRILRSIGLHSFIFPCRLFLVRRYHEIDNHTNSQHDGFNNWWKSFKLAPGILYTGSYGPLQKFTVELLSETEKTIAYSKFGHDYLTNEAIKREYNALKQLEKITIPKINVPSIIDYKIMPITGDTILTQTNISDGKQVQSISNELVDSLVNLFLHTSNGSKINIDEYTNYMILDIENFINEVFINDLVGYCKIIIKALKKIKAQSGAKNIPLSTSHGDMTRWNITMKNSCLQLFDWEEVKMRPPGHDLLNFFFTENLLVRNLPEEKIAAISLDICLKQHHKHIFRYFEKLSTPEINYKIYLILFWAEIARLNLWHVIRHCMNNYQKKDHLHKIIRASAMSCSKLLEF